MSADEDRALARDVRPVGEEGDPMTSDTWTCEHCGLRNAALLWACGSCGVQRATTASAGVASRSEYPAGSETLVVHYVSFDSARSEDFHAAMAADARSLEETRGLRLVSLSVYPLRNGAKK